MAKQSDLDNAYMKSAFAFAELSHATRKKVGALLVVPEGGRFEGVNGMPEGFDNSPETMEEYEEFVELGVTRTCTRLVTKPECLHAEANAIMKVARSTTSSISGTIYTTLTPCLECAKLIIQAKIVRVVYAELYPYPGHSGPSRALGLELLEQAGVQVDYLPWHTTTADEIELQDEGRLDNDPRHHTT